ncbi:hypothetical protein [uncultured Roseovarius sp.]|uniref:hypothetical protein n=1 Tax=uncultured Roseovarius sp. TaxID=293344 RepID=UPI002617BDC3|nr:hypothetical protein [uncultured Roseovarius sp.]
MSIQRRGFLTLTTAFACLQFVGNAQAETSEIRTELQVALQRHLERSQIDGAIHFVDQDTATVQKLYPIKAHPLIFKGNNFFVMCAELRDEQGEKYEVDFYLVQARRGYRVVMTEIKNRKNLLKMMRAGNVKKF